MQPLHELSIRLDSLRDWPDKIIITEATGIANVCIQSAHEVTSTIMSRLINPNLNASYKLPIFYLIDSIMKTVGGPYAAMFAKVCSN